SRSKRTLQVVDRPAGLETACHSGIAVTGKQKILRGVSMKGRSAIIAATALRALVAAGCRSSGSNSNAGGTATKSCVATIGMEGPLTGPVAFLGQEQLHFAQLAVATDNLANK